jgi:hypothetical protein
MRTVGGSEMIAARRVLIALMVAFAVASLIATLTTIRQVRREASSTVQPTTSSAAQMTFGPSRPIFDVRRKTKPSPA